MRSKSQTRILSGTGGSDARSDFLRREKVEPHISVWQPLYSRITYRNFDVNYIRLERGVKPEHAHASLQVSVALSRPPMIAAERKSFGIVSRQPFLDGEVCVIPSWQRHAVNWDGQTEWVSFHLAPHFLERAALAYGAKPSIEFVPSFCRRDPQIFRLGNALGAVLRDGGIIGEPPDLYVEALADSLVEHLFDFYAADKTKPRLLKGGLAPKSLRRVAEFVEANLESNLTIEELARASGLSRFHFARAFKQSTGFAPYQYVIKQRIERAKILLATKNLPIAGIGFSVGFKNQSHFTKLFRGVVGITPKAYRAR